MAEASPALLALLWLLIISPACCQELQNVLRLYTDPECRGIYPGADSQQSWDIPLITAPVPYCITFTASRYCQMPDAGSATCERRLTCSFASQNGLVLQRQFGGDLCSGEIIGEEAFFDHLSWHETVDFLDGVCTRHSEAGIWMQYDRPWRSSVNEPLFPNCSYFADGGPEGRVAEGTYILQLYTNPLCQIESVAGHEDPSEASRFYWKETATGCFEFTDETDRSEDLLNSDAWRDGALDLRWFSLVCDGTTSGYTVNIFSTDSCTGGSREDTFFWETCHPDMHRLFEGECVQVGAAWLGWWSQGWVKFDKAWPDGTIRDCTGPDQRLPDCPGDVQGPVIQVNYDENGRYNGRVSTSVTWRPSCRALVSISCILLLSLRYMIES
mmetsp:Transcript_32739/g.59834  ORF Transcript_32739/g.59834 Transcript_32739/m.59834 type:complete len:384 (+) Transcript_32739:64-1215(+)